MVVAVLYVTPYRYTPRRLNSWSEASCAKLLEVQTCYNPNTCAGRVGLDTKTSWNSKNDVCIVS